MRKTKIICTLGPATDKEAVLEGLMKNGMNVARMNFSHSDHTSHRKRFEAVVAMREKLGLFVATMLDTKGPEIRLKTFQGGKAILSAGQSFTLTTREVQGDETQASVTYSGLPGDVRKGDTLLIDDGLIELIVDCVTDSDIRCTVRSGGAISDRKGVNAPGITLNMPYISEQDRKDLLFGAELGFDFVAASFVTNANNILEIRKILNEAGKPDIKIIAKIENDDGVRNIDEILDVADGIMIARGDMGVEIDFANLPAVQKILIKKAYSLGKQVITATQMLESMIHNPRPTRAEATDVANAIYDGTSAIMLSGETAAGAYPVEALKAMEHITVKTEADIDYIKRFQMRGCRSDADITNAISHATVTTAIDIGASAIITVTKSGRTARMISKYRPHIPIFGCSPNARVCRQMNLYWGVYPLLTAEETNTDLMLEHAMEAALKTGSLGEHDLVVITAGVPIGMSGTTNLLKVQEAKTTSG